MTARSRVPRAVPVVVAGGGPVGLSLAVELGLRGVECLVVEPRRKPTRSRPRAKTLNTRTMEHFRRWGLADRLRATAPLPTSWSQDVSFGTTLLGPEITRFTGVLGLSDDGFSPELGQQLPQYVLEDLLRAVVRELPACTLLLGSRVVAVDGDAVRINDAHGDVVDVRADYVVGADGARSTVREAIGARYEGNQALRPNTGVVFRSTELLHRLPHRPAVQTWLLNERTPGLMGPIDRTGTWWLIAFGVNGTSPDLDAVGLVQGALGEDLPVEIVSTDPWTARMELVDRARADRVFLIGDAAHLNPPFGGHGLNTGIGDAVDLGWKLAACLDGWGGPELLASHEAERRPLQQLVIAEATANMATLATELLTADLDAPGQRGALARARAAEHIVRAKTAEYFSLDLVLGHRYEASPILPPGAEPTGQWAVRAGRGRRLPHFWCGPGLALHDRLGSGYTVVASPAADIQPIVAAAWARRMPTTITRVTPDQSAALGAEIVVVRPDQVVAWCGSEPPADADVLIDTLTGHHAATLADTSARER
ncbi:FAD-dependent monooxygenase [Cryptosporangium sp. NPDC048952]|uniref:FAD-dependent monooxygenase n=1 Tax=Cryptosporangium sp. NPDC048952 TaxID=3363961 RepID=UPI003719BD86